MIIETLDGGEIETGFWGTDISKIQLGELPLMTTPQFVGYAALALTEGIIPKLDAETHAAWAPDARSLREGVENLRTLQLTGKFFMQTADELAAQYIAAEDADDKAELGVALSAAAAPTEEAVYYPQNPFRVQTDGQRVGFVHEDEVRHVVDKEDFFNLAHRVISGGIMGWNEESGTYQEVKDAAVQIDRALNG